MVLWTFGIIIKNGNDTYTITSKHKQKFKFHFGSKFNFSQKYQLRCSRNDNLMHSVMDIKFNLTKIWDEEILSKNANEMTNEKAS